MKIFATADNHLGKNLKKRKALRELAIENFRAIPDKISSCKDIDYVIFAGDVFDKENTDIQCHNIYADTLSKIADIETVKKILVITGNHDQYNDYFDGASVDLAKLVKSDKIVVCNKDHLIYHNEDDDVLFFLLPYHKELFLDNEAGNKIITDKINGFIMQLFTESKFESSYKILVSHFPLKDWMPFSTEALTKDDLTAGDHFNLVILGDLHNETYEDLNRSTPILYTGSTMQTSIADLYNHENCAKVIDIQDSSLNSVDLIKFKKPNIIILDEENFESKKKKINSETIVITADLNIHTALKDRVLYSLYKPVVNKEVNVLDTINDSIEIENLDINQLAKDKIAEDKTLDEDTKTYLITLIDLDTESLDNTELSETIKTTTMEGLI